MTCPIIGITATWSTRQSGAQNVDQRYVEAVIAAGGAPILLPIIDAGDQLSDAVAALDGLIITGGNGIVDGLIGQLPDDLLEESEGRTRRDLHALDQIVAAERPVLGICFGMQLINARFGGTICGDAEKQRQARPHSPKRNEGSSVNHTIEIFAGTRLETLCDGQVRPEVNSFHIQTIEKLGAGLCASSISPDGLVESLETENGQVVGVQFHPERMASSLAMNLFVDLVSRARS